MKVPLTATVNLGFTLVLLILLAISFLCYRTVCAMIVLDEQIAHTRLVEVNLEEVLSLATDAEMGQSSFLLTGDESYLAPFTNTTEAIGQRMVALRTLTQDDPADRSKLDDLQSQIDVKFSELRETIAVRRTGGLAAALPRMQANRDKNTMGRIRSLVASTEDDENALLRQRNSELAADAQQTLVVIVIGSALALGAIGGSMVLINLAVSARQRVAEERARLLDRENAARVEAERARAQLTTTLERITDGFIALDAEWRYTYVNPRVAELIGRNAEDVLGRCIWDLYPDAVGLAFERRCRQAAADQVPTHFDAYYAAVDRWFEFRVYPSVDGLSIYIQDITERTQSEEETRRLLRAVAVERTRFQAILESAANGIVYVDALTGQIIANPAAERLFGHPLIAEQGVSQYLGQIQLNGGPIRMEELPSQRALQGQLTAEQEMLIVRPDGRPIPVLESAAPVRGPDDRVIGAVAVFQDISALKDIERLQGEWASVIAHDLRQPASIIMGYAEIAATEAEQSNPDLTRMLDRISFSAHRLNRMIEDILDMSRLESRNLRLEPRDVDVVPVTWEIVDRFTTVTPTPPIRVQVDGEIPHVTIDSLRFEQILVNLLSNGAKYGRPDTEIVVTIARRVGDVLVSVTNQGDGIAPEALPRLFTRFQRIHGGSHRGVEGMGLGLYITKGLVEAHGGRIWAESLPGSMTTFTFTLPLTAQHPVTVS